jgi:hypothetical protein
MYAGAVLEAIGAIITLVTIGSLKTVILNKHPGYTTAQLHTAERVAVVGTVIGGLIAVGLWLWMAWANRQGRNWARVVSAVLFGIGTLDLLGSFAQVHVTATVAFAIVVWLVGLGAIVLIFRKESGPFYGKGDAG